jgi:OPT family oligopeptide transporter
MATPELTLRALFAGCLLGAMLAAANVYTALKTGYIDGGSITAAVLSFAVFRAFARPYSTLENNLTQTVASSAAVMSFVAGVAGPIPALARAGHVLPSGVLVAWTLALAVLGISIAVALRPRLIAAEGLPFPTGTATAEVITAMADASGHAMRRARGLLIAAAVAASIAWLRDGPAGWLPQSIDFTGSIAGIAASELSLGISVSPLMFATGLISGLRAGVSMLAGGLIAWVGVLPLLIGAGIVPRSDHGSAVGWLLWPAVALVLSSSLTSLAMQWRTLAGGLVDLRALLGGGGAATRVGLLGGSRAEAMSGELLGTGRPEAASGAAPDPPAAVSGSTLHSLAPLLVLVVLSVVVIIVIAQQLLGVSPLTIVLALTLSVALAVVCARGAGETDIAPAGDMGGLTQLIFGSPVNTASSLACGGIATANATQTAQTLWAFKAGQKLGANPRHQILAQLLGALVGGLVVVPTYEVVVRAYGLGSERLPAISVLSWEATANAVQGGLQALPHHSAMAAAIAFAFGSLLTLLGKTRLATYAPSPVALGIGFLMPLSMSATLFLGAISLTLLGSRFPTWTREHVESIAGGAIAGESLFAVVLAALIAFGLMSG